MQEARLSRRKSAQTSLVQAARSPALHRAAAEAAEGEDF